MEFHAGGFDEVLEVNRRRFSRECDADGRFLSDVEILGLKSGSLESNTQQIRVSAESESPDENSAELKDS